MASSDSSIAISQIDEAVVFNGGSSETLTLSVAKGTVNWTVTAQPVTEMRIRDKHTATRPTIRKTGDAMVTGSLTIHATSFKGNSAKTPYEVLTGTASWVNTASGDVQTLSMAVTYDASGASVGGGGAAGANQTCTFGFVHFTKVDVAFEDGLLVIKADFEDYENLPTIA